MNEKDEKLTKEELEEDRFVEWLMEAVEYVQQKWQLFAAGLVGVAIILYGISYTQDAAEINKAEAMGVWGEILIADGSGQAEEAQRLAQMLTDAYAGTPAAAQGTLFLANRLFLQENYDEAERLYQRYITDYGTEEALLYGAWSGLASCLDARGQHREAAEKYKAYVEQHSGAQGALALGEAARCYGLAGDAAAQKQMLERLIQEYGETPVATRARQELEML
jgi:tetratricopeptide (TPR) repeat protein